MKNYSTEYRERKKSELIQERTNRRRSNLNLTIHLVVVNLYAKYKFSLSKRVGGGGGIFPPSLVHIGI